MEFSGIFVNEVFFFVITCYSSNQKRQHRQSKERGEEKMEKNQSGPQSHIHSQHHHSNFVKQIH